jgi:CNT family concentrative nucleoside transporter
MLLQTQTAAQRFESLRSGLDIPIAERLIGVLGIAVMIGLAVLMSYDRKRINWRLVASGVAIQVVFGLLVLKTTVGRNLFQTLGDWITALLGF